MGESEIAGSENEKLDATKAENTVGADANVDRDRETGEQPEALAQSSAEQVAVTAASDFVSPKSQTSPFGKAMREISALQAAMAQGVSGSPGDLKASMLRAKSAFVSGGATATSPEDLQSLAQYVLSGGDPSAATKVLQNSSLKAHHRDLIEGVRSFATADLAKARLKLLPLDGKSFGTMLDAQLTMAQVQLDDASSTDQKRKRLSHVANIVPGTLIEEAAIRRLIPLLAQAKDSKALIYWTTRYIRRFSSSLYYQDYESTLVDSLALVSTTDMHVTQLVLDEIFTSANEQQAASLSRKLLLIAVDNGNSLLCDDVQKSLSKTSYLKADGNTDTLALLSVCKAAEGDARVLQDLRMIDTTAMSSVVKANLDKAIVMAEAIQKSIPLKDDGMFGPHLPLSESGDYASLFASVAQQIDSSVAAIKKANDHETRLNK